jgi:RNA-directed DNA polymerase
VSSFDHMDHEWLLRMLRERIDDAPFLNLIQKWLKAGILDTDGMIIHPDSGTPQGGLCEASHKPPYAKKVIMQSRP